MTIEQEERTTVQPSSRKVRIEEMDGELELSYRRRPWGTAGFLLLWLTGWTAATTFLLWKVFAEPSVMLALFAVPFVASWVLVFVLLVWMLFGTESVRLSPEGLEYRAIALWTVCRRTVPRAELKIVSAGLTTYQVAQGDEPARPEPCLKFETMGQPLRFAPGISEQEQSWLIERLNAYLDLFGPRAAPNVRNASTLLARKTVRGEILEAMDGPLEPPSDSRIEMRLQTDAVAFIWTGEWSLATVAALTLVQLFWNGIVGVFIYQLIQDFQWFLFFFLIPFEAMGLFLAALWLAALTAPAWRLTWAFGEREATRRRNVSDADAIVFSFGWSKRFDIRPPIRIELRRREGKEQWGSLGGVLFQPDGEYDLAFLGREDKPLLTIERLNEGDARWIADTLLHAFSSWSKPESGVVLGPEGSTE